MHFGKTAASYRIQLQYGAQKCRARAVGNQYIRKTIDEVLLTRLKSDSTQKSVMLGWSPGWKEDTGWWAGIKFRLLMFRKLDEQGWPLQGNTLLYSPFAVLMQHLMSWYLCPVAGKSLCLTNSPITKLCLVPNYLFPIFSASKDVFHFIAELYTCILRDL